MNFTIVSIQEVRYAKKHIHKGLYGTNEIWVRK